MVRVVRGHVRGLAIRWRAPKPVWFRVEGAAAHLLSEDDSPLGSDLAVSLYNQRGPERRGLAEFGHRVRSFLGGSIGRKRAGAPTHMKDAMGRTFWIDQV